MKDIYASCYLINFMHKQFKFYTVNNDTPHYAILLLIRYFAIILHDNYINDARNRALGNT